jgi:hypothetical protein
MSVFEYLEKVRLVGEQAATDELVNYDQCEVIMDDRYDRQEEILKALNSTWFGSLRSYVLKDGTTVVNDLHDDYNDEIDESPNLAAQTGFSSYIISLGKDVFESFCTDPERQLPPHNMRHFQYIDRVKTWVPKSKDDLIKCLREHAEKMKKEGKYDPDVQRMSLNEFFIK